MNDDVPAFRKHADGRYMTKWGSRNRYFGRDRDAALKRYAESIEEWRQWREGKRRAATVMPARRITVLQLAQQFVAAKSAEGGIDLERYYRKHLRRFLVHAARVPADDVRVGDLAALRNDMLKARRPDGTGYAPKTVNHDIIAVKAMFQWAMDQELIPPVNLRGCRTLRLPPPPEKGLSLPDVRRMILDARTGMKPWLATNYLTGMRPSEMVRVVNGHCQWVEPWLVRVPSKNDRRTGEPRHVVFSDLARKWISRCVPIWSRLDSYSQAVREDCVHGPGILRHSAQKHLLAKGASQADTNLILGHLPGRVVRTYGRKPWQLLLPTASLLTL